MQRAFDRLHAPDVCPTPWKPLHLRVPTAGAKNAERNRMRKYRIMIVDDEYEVREGIAGRVDWDAAGFEIVTTAENGQDALEKAESLDLDVVLTDIKMPFMDGLTFGAELQKRLPAVKLIILTGFDAFEYAKEAIKLNVLEYVLKPVNVEELTQVLLRVKTKLDEEFLAKQDVEALRESYRNALPLVQDQYLREVLTGAMPSEDAEQLIRHYGIALDPSKEMIVAVFDTNVTVPDHSAITQDLLPVSVKRLAEDVLNGKCTFAAFVSFFAVIVVASWENDPVDSMVAAANEICNECKALYATEITAGVGRRCDAVVQLRESLFEARAAVEYQRVVGSGKAIYIRDVEHMTRHPILLDSRYEQRLISAVKFGSREQIEAEIDGMLSGLRDATPGEWKYRAYVTGILNAIIQIIGRYDLPASEVMAGEGEQLFSEVGASDAETLKHRLAEVCARIGGYMSRRRLSMAGNLVGQAKQFIQDNYSRSDLSLETVCEHLHISQSYFSSIFKQDTGRSFVQYLTDMRMERATELLRETDEKTYVVARELGYEEPNYFSYVFKKRFGMTPSQYRNGR